jgi:processive 1,2-diacylglycerol beta-glucosyltransferase
VLVLFCEEGNGHASTARALSEELSQQAKVNVTVEDAFRGGLGRLIPLLSRDVYRLQIRRLRWTYGLEYWLFTRFPPARAFARRGLAFLGGRPLRRLIESAKPDVIVSTHPSVTNVLGFLRRRGRLTVPTIAVISDFGVHALWAHRGLDLHLVMHEECVRAVERVAGPGSALVVAPILASEFRSPRSAIAARRALGLPEEGLLVLISGGGWGVGGVEAAAAAALEVSGLTVVCLSGRSRSLQRRLEQRFRTAPRVHVIPFTDRMPELLAAADVLVDSTIGVTCLEAISSGCRIVTFGVPPGHSRDNERALVALGFAQRARSSAELAASLRWIVAEKRVPGPPRLEHGLRDAVFSVRARTPPARSHRRVVVGLAAGAASLVFAGWTFASPTPYPVVARVFHLRELTRVETDRREAALIVESQQLQIAPLAQALAHEGIHVSFATPNPLAPATARRVGADGDEVFPEVAAGGPTTILHTGARLARIARSLGLRHRFYYLAQGSRLTLGDYLSARAVGGEPVRGTRIDETFQPRPGDIVVLSAGANPASVRVAVGTAAKEMSAHGLRPVPLRELLASAARARPTGGELARTSAPAATSASATESRAAPPGDDGHHSCVRSGARPTGMKVFSAKTVGATCETGRRCRADISLSVPRPDATIIAPNHATTAIQRCRV